MELLEVFRAAGDLPHGRVGDYLFARLSADVDEFAARVKDLLPPGAPEPVDVAHAIGGFHVTGRLTGLSVQGCVQMRYAGIKAKDFLTIWLQHLLLCLAAPGVPDRRSLLIGKGQAWAFGPVPGAEQILEALLDVYRRGLLEPLPFFPESSRAFFEKLANRDGDEPHALAAARSPLASGATTRRVNPKTLITGCASATASRWRTTSNVWPSRFFNRSSSMAGKFPGERGMEIGSLIRIALNAGAEKLFREEMPLQAGDLLRLKVIDVREDNRALVDFGKFRALAEVGFPVSAGDELTVKVIDTKGQLRLTLVAAGAETAPAPAAAEPVRPFAAHSLTQLR